MNVFKDNVYDLEGKVLVVGCHVAVVKEVRDPDTITLEPFVIDGELLDISMTDLLRGPYMVLTQAEAAEHMAGLLEASHEGGALEQEIAV